jgi:hypothetical protein
VTGETELEELRDAGQPFLAVEQLLHLSLHVVLHEQMVAPLAVSWMPPQGRLWTA